MSGVPAIARRRARSDLPRKAEPAVPLPAKRDEFRPRPRPQRCQLVGDRGHHAAGEVDRFRGRVGKLRNDSVDDPVGIQVTCANTLGDSEFWRVIGGHGPCNRERLAARVKAWDDGAWVREAALAHAAKQEQTFKEAA